MSLAPLARRAAFTLVELLVVIAIIGILISLLLPAVQAAREAARRSSCANNLMQLSIGLQHYESVHELYPPGVVEETGPIQSVAQGYHVGWLVQLLPYIEEKNAFAHIDFKVGVYHLNNARVAALRLPLLQCPSEWVSPSIGCSNYAACHHDVEAPIDADNDGVFFLNSRIGHEDVADGSAHTIFVGEKLLDEQGDLGWMSGTRATLRNTGMPINGTPSLGTPAAGGMEPSPAQQPLADEALEAAAGAPAGPPAPGAQASSLWVGGFGSHHPAGANFTFGDGRVRLLTGGMSPTVLQQLGHRADGQLLDEY
jgi:prepilin-type N-terminal cleavage/methylation domain-containing protein